MSMRGINFLEKEMALGFNNIGRVNFLVGATQNVGLALKHKIICFHASHDTDTPPSLM